MASGQAPAGQAGSELQLKLQLAILDTDIGDDIDDAFALALALRSPELKILGITTAFADTELRARLVDRFLAAVGRTDIQVAAGVPTPHDNVFTQAAYARQEPERKHADGVAFLLEQIRAHPGEVTLIAIGPLVNVGEAIKRIDETTRTRFIEAFAAINTNFQQTFSTLFGGGRAGLALLDENDPLESGIEIIAQPPGKRLQSVQLLSGGEKALTAIALMFGMFKYKPSPFCVLDEIDAPLDEANIGRFVEMLRGMQQHTQFIIITHSRKTMEIADRLYGVTMEEPGVSKLISVQLN